MADALGIELHPDVLPFSNIPAFLPPYPAPTRPGHDDGRVTSDEVPSTAIVLEGDGATLTVDAQHGARLASLVVDGHELLVTEGDGPIWWGCYPMVAVRRADPRRTLPVPRPAVRRPAVAAAERHPRDRPGPAVGRSPLDPTRAWSSRPISDRTGRSAAGWSSRSSLVPGGMEAALRLEADEPMPAVLGWHPWFRRSVGGAQCQAGVRGTFDVPPRTGRPADRIDRSADAGPVGRRVRRPA